MSTSQTVLYSIVIMGWSSHKSSTPSKQWEKEIMMWYCTQPEMWDNTSCTVHTHNTILCTNFLSFASYLEWWIPSVLLDHNSAPLYSCIHVDSWFHFVSLYLNINIHQLSSYTPQSKLSIYGFFFFVLSTDEPNDSSLCGLRGKRSLLSWSSCCSCPWTSAAVRRRPCLPAEVPVPFIMGCWVGMGGPWGAGIKWPTGLRLELAVCLV